MGLRYAGGHDLGRAGRGQWLRGGATLTDGTTFTVERYESIRARELSALQSLDATYFNEAAELLDALVLSEGFDEFLTLKAYERLP